MEFKAFEPAGGVEVAEALPGLLAAAEISEGLTARGFGGEALGDIGFGGFGDVEGDFALPVLVLRMLLEPETH